MRNNDHLSTIASISIRIRSLCLNVRRTAGLKSHLKSRQNHICGSAVKKKKKNLGLVGLLPYISPCRQAAPKHCLWALHCTLVMVLQGNWAMQTFLSPSSDLSSINYILSDHKHGCHRAKWMGHIFVQDWWAQQWCAAGCGWEAWLHARQTDPYSGVKNKYVRSISIQAWIHPLKLSSIDHFFKCGAAAFNLKCKHSIHRGGLTLSVCCKLSWAEPYQQIHFA